MAETIGSMTLEQLKILIREEISRSRPPVKRAPNPDEAADFHRWIQTHRIPQQAGDKSVDQMLREDRDR